MIRHVAFTLASRVSAILALLLCTPFYYRVLGPDGYALIAISLIAHSLSGLIDAGLSPLAAAALARARDSEAGRTVILSEIFGKSGRRIAPLWFAAIAGMSLYNIIAEREPNFGSVGTVVTNLILFSDVFLLVFFRINYACLQGFGRHAAANILYTVTLGLRAVLGVGAVVIFRTPQAVLAGQALGSIAGIATAIFILEYSSVELWRTVSRPWRRMRTDQTSIDAAALRNLWAISVFASTTSVVPQLVVKFLGTPADLSRFSLAGSIANALLAFQTAYQAVLLPEFARTTASPSVATPNAAAGRAMAGTFIIACICGASYVMAENILALWLGDFDKRSLAHIATLMRWQLVSVALLAATAVPYVLCIVQGRTKPQLYTSIIYLVLMMLGAPLGHHIDGTLGVAIASTFATGMFSILYILAAERASLSARAVRLVRWAILPILAGALPAIATLLLLPRDPPASYGDAVGKLCLQGVVAAALSVGIALPAYRFRTALSGRRRAPAGSPDLL